MGNLIFKYNEMLECLKFMKLDISDFSEINLKKKYRILAKEYHPDLSEYENSTKKFCKLANSYEYLKFCLTIKSSWEHLIDINYNKTCNSCSCCKDNLELKKKYQDLAYKFDKLIRPLKIQLNGYITIVIKFIINNLVNNIEILKNKAMNPDNILDYGTLSNYYDLIELFIEKVLNIKSSIPFDLKKNNYIGSIKDKFLNIKSEVCFLERILLYEEIIKIIDYINREGKYINIKQYNDKMPCYFEKIDDITDKIQSFKWLLLLSNLENSKVTEELNKIKKYRK